MIVFHIVQQILEWASVRLNLASPWTIRRINTSIPQRVEEHNVGEFEDGESKVASLKKFASKKGGEVYK